MGRRGHKKHKEFRRAVRFRFVREKNFRRSRIFCLKIFFQKVDEVRQARREKQENASGDSANPETRVNQYEEIVKENPLFENYYKVFGTEKNEKEIVATILLEFKICSRRGVERIHVDDPGTFARHISSDRFPESSVRRDAFDS